MADCWKCGHDANHHLRAMIQALEEAKEFSRRDNQMAAMAEIKIAEARKRAEAAEARVREVTNLLADAEHRVGQTEARVAELERASERLENRHAEASTLIRVANDAAKARKAERDEARKSADRLAEAAAAVDRTSWDEHECQLPTPRQPLLDLQLALAAYESETRTGALRDWPSDTPEAEEHGAVTVPQGSHPSASTGEPTEKFDPVERARQRGRDRASAPKPEARPDTERGCAAYIGGYCGDDGQLCGACVFDADLEGRAIHGDSSTLRGDSSKREPE